MSAYDHHSDQGTSSTGRSVLSVSILWLFLDSVGDLHVFITHVSAIYTRKPVTCWILMIMMDKPTKANPILSAVWDIRLVFYLSNTLELAYI